MGDHDHSEGCKALDLAYQRAGESYEAITEFRAKLLALLPLATGTAAFLLLERAQADGAQLPFLGPIGIFGVVVTLGLFAYELRGMQRCHRLEVQAGTLEKQLGLSAEQGPFLGQPKRALGNMLGPPAAGLIIYLATVCAWLWLAGYGLGRWGVHAWGLLIGYGAVLLVAWILLSRWMRRSAVGGLPKRWKNRSEKLAFDYEQASLRQAGHPGLADRVRWVAREDGNGPGYDIRSYDTEGRERHIGVKATALGSETPFSLTSAELDFAQRHRDSYVLYRVSNVLNSPQFDELKGNVADMLEMTPVIYRAWRRANDSDEQ